MKSSKRAYWQAAKKAFSLVLSVVLASGCMLPTAAFATESDLSSTGEALTSSSDGSSEETQLVGGAENTEVIQQAASQGNTAEGDASEAATNATETDISEAWHKGSLTLSQGGVYFLSADVETDGTLFIAAPYDETITLDLRGHSATVSGVVDAGIDVSSSEGTVVITDSTYDANKESSPSAKLSVQGRKAQAVVCGILGNFAEPDDTECAMPRVEVSDIAVQASLITADAKSDSETFDCYGAYFGIDAKQPARNIDVSVLDCAFLVAVCDMNGLNTGSLEAFDAEAETPISTDRAGIACGVYAARASVLLDGAFSFTEDSAGGTADLYAACEKAFSIGDHFAAGEGGASSYVELTDGCGAFATLENGAGDSVAGVFSYAGADNIEATVEDSCIVFSERSIKDAVSSNELAVDDEAAKADGATIDLSDADPAESDGVEVAITESDTNDEVDVTGGETILFSFDGITNALNAIMLSALDDSVAEEDDLSIHHLSEATEVAANLDPGSYVLDNDIAVTSAAAKMQMTMPGEYVLDLQGKTLTFGSDADTSAQVTKTRGILLGKSLSGANIKEENKTTVTIKNGNIRFLNGGLIDMYDNVDLTLDGVSVSREYTTYTNFIKSPTCFCCAIYVEPGNNKASAVDVLMGIHLKDSSLTVNAEGLDETPPTGKVDTVYGIYMDSASGLASFNIVNSAINVQASRKVVQGAVGIQANVASKADGAPDMRLLDGSSVLASAPLGDATGISIASTKTTNAASTESYGFMPSYVFEGSSSIALEALGSAVGVSLNKNYAEGTGGLTLNGKFAFSVNKEADKVVALQAGDDYPGGGFVIGNDFSASGLSMQIGSVDDASNNDGVYLAKFAEGTSFTDEQKQALASVFSNAVASEIATLVTYDDIGIKFAVDPDKAPARVGDKLYASFALAVSALSCDGETDTQQTITLLKDADALVFDKKPNDIKTNTYANDTAYKKHTYTVDMNGHSVKSFTCDSYGNVILMDSTGKAKALSGTVQASDNIKAAVVQKGPGALTLRNIDIAVGGGSLEKCGIFYRNDRKVGARTQTNNSGLLIVEGGSIKVTSNSSDAYGIYANPYQAASAEASLITLNQVFVTVEQTGSGSAYGAYLQTATKYESINTQHSNIRATSSGESAVGIYANSRGSVVIDESFINATNLSENGKATCVFSGANPQTTTVIASTLDALADDEALGSEEADYACITSSGAFTLKGECSFLSAGRVHILYDYTPFALDDFTLSDESAQPLVVECESSGGSKDDILATGSNLTEEDASLFTPSSSSENFYDGWDLETAQDGSSIAWTTEDAAQIKEGDATRNYKTLAAAIAAAKDGDTITLLRDCASPTLAVSHPMTIDLNGKSLTVRSSAETAIGVSAAEGSVVFEDTASEKGILNIEVGGTNESRDVFYHGISHAGACDLVFDGVQLSCAYTGNTSKLTDMPQVSLAAVYLADGAGSLSVKSGSSIQVSSQADLVANFGAASVYGIYLGASAGAGKEVLIDSTSSVEAYSMTGLLQCGRTDPVENNIYDGVTLVAVEIDPESDIYQSILEKFRQVAKHDVASTISEESMPYGNGIYYAAPMTLDDGTEVWAFSEPVLISEGVSSENIVPVRFYVQTSYQVAPEATGIGGKNLVSLSSSADGVRVRLQGSVRARSASGDACAVSATTAGSWSVEGAALEAVAGNASYKGRSAACPDLSKSIEGVSPQSSGSVFYPDNAAKNARELVDKDPQAVLVRQSWTDDDSNRLATIGRDTSITLAGSITAAVSGLSVLHVMADQIVVGDGFSLGDGGDPVLLVTDANGDTIAGDVFAIAANEDVDLKAARSLFADANETHDPALGDTGIEWGDGECTVRFVGWHGEILAEKQASNGQLISFPSEDDMAIADTGDYAYTYLGWSLIEGCTKLAEGDLAKEEAALSFAAVDGETTRTYYAVYDVRPVTVTVTFKGARDAMGNTLASVFKSVPRTKALSDGGVSVTDVAAYDYAIGDAQYVFIGWRGYGVNGYGTNIFDSFDLLGLTLDCSTVFQAYYEEVPEGEHLVVFKVGDVLYPQLVKDGDTPSYEEAAINAGIQDPGKFPSEPLRKETGMTYSFAGWQAGSGHGDLTVDYTAQALPTAVDNAVYTAVFNSKASDTGLQFAFYQDFGAGNMLYAKYPSTVTCSYGDNPYDVAETRLDIAKEFVKKETATLSDTLFVYRFLGWSTRWDDAEPMWTAENKDQMPSVTSGANSPTTYWGIYSKQELTADVVFMVKDEQGDYVEYATVKDQPLSTRLADIVAAGEFTNPQMLADGSVFQGWSDSVNEEDLSLGTTTVYSCLSDDQDSLTLYAVYEEHHGFAVSLYDNDGIDDETVYWTLSTGLDGTIEAPVGFANPNKAGCSFNGWNTEPDGSGSSFDLGRDTVEADMALYAQYLPMELAEGAAEGITVDFAGAYVDKDSAVGSGGVILTAEARDVPDANLAEGLSSRVAGSQAYLLRLWYDNDGVPVNLTSGFGTVEVTLPLPSEAAGREVSIYWLNANGEVARADASTTYADGQPVFTLQYASEEEASLADTNEAESGDAVAVTLALRNYAVPATGGNLVIAYNKTDAEVSLELTQSNALSQLQEEYNAYYEGDYDSGDWAFLVDAFESGCANVKNAANAQDAADAANVAIQAMAEVPTMQGLATARANDLERLAKAYASYSKSNYTSDNWSKLVAEYESACLKITQANTIEDAASAASAGIVAMSNIPAGGESSSSSGSSSGSSSSTSSNVASGSNTSGGSTNTSSSGVAGGSSSGDSSGLPASNGLSSSYGSGLSAASTGSGLSASSGLSAASSSSSSGLATSNGLLAATSGNAQDVLGVVVEAVTPELVTQKELSADAGAYVNSVVEGGPAQVAGILAGDVITKINDQDIVSLDDLDKALEDKGTGDVVDVTVDRNGEPLTYQVTLGDTTSDDAALGLTTLESFDEDDVVFNDSEDAGEEAQDGFLTKWLVPIIVATIALIAAVTLLCWWLMRRRNKGLIDGDEADTAQNGEAPIPSIQI